MTLEYIIAQVIEKQFLLIPLAFLFAAVVFRRVQAVPPLGLVLASGALLGLAYQIQFWLGGLTHPNALAGLIQWNDAMGYFGCVRKLNAGAELSSLCSMRPLYSASFGGLYRLSGAQLPMALLMQAAIVGLASSWAAWLLARRYGLSAGLAAYGALHFYAVAYTVPVLTENFGLIYGSLALIYLWQRGERISPLQLGLATAVLGLALTGRSGAMFTLPAILVWQMWAQGPDLKTRAYYAVAWAAGLGAAVGINWLLIQMFGGASEHAQSNFAYTFYAMTAGGRDYLKVFDDHPELNAVPTAQALTMMMDLAWQNIFARPHVFVQSYVAGLWHWLRHLFDFTMLLPVRLILMAVWAVGVLSCVRRWRQHQDSFMLALLVSVALSAPFLTFFGGTRIFAATYIVDVLFVAAGVQRLLVNVRAQDYRTQTYPGWGFTAVLVLLCAYPVLSAGVLRFTAPILQPVQAELTCPSGEYPFVARTDQAATVVRLLDTDQSVHLTPGDVERDAFVERVDSRIHRYYDLIDLAPGTVLMDVMQFLDTEPLLTYGSSIPMLWSGELPQGTVQGCVDLDATDWIGVPSRIEAWPNP